MLKAGEYIISDPCYIVPNIDYVYFRPLFDVPPSLSEEDFHKLEKEYKKADIWANWLDENNYFDPADYYILESFKCFAGTTKYGDGYYPLLFKDEFVKNLAVDSGTLSIIPVGLFNKLNPGVKVEDFVKKKNMALISVEKDFEVKYKNGDFYFDDYFIETSGSEDDY